MVTKFFKTVLLITAVQFLLSSGCNKNSTTPCTNGNYSFKITSEWSQPRETYNIGDTIYLTSSFLKTLTDQINMALTVDYTGSTDIGGSYSFYELDTIQHQVKGAVLKFDILPATGSVSDGLIVPLEKKSIIYKELSVNYLLALKVIPKTKGIFAIFISDLHSNGLKGKNCTNADFTNILSNPNKNISLFQYAMGRPPASQYETDRIYCFRVQ